MPARFSKRRARAMPIAAFAAALAEGFGARGCRKICIGVRREFPLHAQEQRVDAATSRDRRPAARLSDTWATRLLLAKDAAIDAIDHFSQPTVAAAVEPRHQSWQWEINFCCQKA